MATGKRGGRPSLVKLVGAVYHRNFSVNGRRFRGSLGTGDKQVAEAVAATEKAKYLHGKLTGEKPEITLKAAIVRHWGEQAQHWRTASQAKIHNTTLARHLGEDTFLSAFNFGQLSAFVALRRGRLENASVNRETAHLRSIVNACVKWGYRTAEISWRSLRLDEPENRQTLLPAALEAEFLAALRQDFRSVVRFGLMTGLRKENVLGLKWTAIDDIAGTITLRTKSKKPGGKFHMIELTAGMRAVLGVERGRHPEYVFTYLCQHVAKDRRPGVRYPLALDGGNFRRDWQRARIAIGLPELRFHDLRHTFGTRLAKLAPLGVVQRALGHADINTTMRYASSDQAQVREAMERLEAQTQRVELTRIRHSEPDAPAKKDGTSNS
jgi:integrase